jgi:hypothetical protein
VLVKDSKLLKLLKLQLNESSTILKCSHDRCCVIKSIIC